MNYGRLVLAAVAGTLVDACYGFVVYGMLLTSEFARTPGVYRAMDTQAAYMPFLFGGVFLAMLAAALLGVFAAGYAALIGYSITNIGRKMAGELVVANLVEWTINGIIIGLVYKPSPKR